MKKLLSIVLTAAVTLSLAACGNGANNAQTTQADTQAAATTAQDATTAESKQLTKLVVGASTTPHAEILEQVVEDLAAEGYELQIVEFTDYVLPNTSLHDGSLNANYFQHKPYLDSFNEENKTNIVSAAAIHYEPFGIYPGKTKTLADLPEKAKIAVPNDPSNEARALLLLEQEGLIKLKAGVGLNATVNDIEENAHNYEIVELAAEQVARSLPDVDAGVINGNNALAAGLNVAKDAIAKEASDSIAATTYANIIAVNAGNENDPGVVALIKALQSEKVKKFIEEKYEGSVVPIF